MKLIILLSFVFVVSGTSNDVNPICSNPQKLANPRTCCLDPRLITDKILETCSKSLNCKKRANVHMDSAGQNKMDTDENAAEETLSKESRSYRKKANKSNDSSSSSSSEEDKRDSYRKNLLDPKSSSSSSEEDVLSRHGKHHGHHHHDNHGRHGHHGHHGDHGHHRKHKHHRHHHYKGKYAKHQKQMACFMECVFKESGIMENDTVKMDNVKTYLAEAIEDKTFVPIVEDAFRFCVKTSNLVRKQMETMPGIPLLPLEPHAMQVPANNSCKQWPKLIMMCVKAQIFLNCPANKFRNDDVRCLDTQEYVKSCQRLPPMVISSLVHY